MLLLFSLFISSSLCAECGPSVSPVTTMAIIEVESGGNPYAIGDNTTRRSHQPKTKEEAVRLARQLIAAGHSIDMGLMQINSQHLKSMKLNLSDLFDPCTNIKIGTCILADFYRLHDTVPDKNQVLFRALSSYNTGSAWKGPGYINKILAKAKAPYRVTLKGEVPRSSRTASQTSPKLKPLQPQKAPLFFSESDLYPQMR